MKKITLLFSLLAVVLFAGCSLDNSTCNYFEQAPVIATNTPDTGQVNVDVPITLTFTVYNGCGNFGNIKELKNGTTWKIAVYANYYGCVCPQAVMNLQTTYNFKTGVPGTYYLKFYGENNEFITDTIVMQ